MFIRFDRIHERDKQTNRQIDGQTDGHCATVYAALVHSITLQKHSMWIPLSVYKVRKSCELLLIYCCVRTKGHLVNNDIVNYCRAQFEIDLPSTVVDERSKARSLQNIDRVKMLGLYVNLRNLCHFVVFSFVFIARQHTDARYWYSKSVCLSIRPSVTFRYQMKTA